MVPKTLSERIVDILEDRKARDVVVIDIAEVTVIADFFVICSGTSTTHIKAITDEVEKRLEDDHQLRFKRREGYSSAKWVLLDYGDVIVHIFNDEDRKFYDIERLWADGVITYDARHVDSVGAARGDAVDLSALGPMKLETMRQD